MAGITHLKEFQKPALRGLIDAAVADKKEVPAFGDRFLPDDRIYNMTFGYDIIMNSQHIGAMIGFGAEPPIVDRGEVAAKMGEIAKMGLKYVATEEELLMLNQARNDGEKQALVDKLTVKGIDLVNALLRRVDVIKAEALTKGKFEYNKNGVKATIDFGVPAEHKVALSSGSDWKTPNRDVIGDLMDWVDTYAATNGYKPDVILISRETQALLLKNAVIVNEARGANSGTARVSVDELNSVLGGYGLPPIQVVENRKITVKDIYTGKKEVIEVMPVNRVVMLSEGVGNFLYGPTVENDFQPGIVLDAYDKEEPIQSILRTVAAGFPVVEAPSLIFHADVYTP